MHPQFLSNTYLVGEPGGAGFFVDAGGPVEPLIAAAERHDMTPTHVLLTHHHHDHVERARQAHRALARPRGAHPPRRARRRRDRRDGPRRDRRASATSRCARCTRPGHTEGHALAARRGQRLHRRHAVQELGRRRARARATRPTPTSSTRSWTCCSRCRPRPSSAPATPSPRRSAEEWETNAFVRVWRGLDPEGDEPCTALGEPATLVLLGDDYDGGHKAWVRWPDGSRRHRAAARRSSGASGPPAGGR